MGNGIAKLTALVDGTRSLRSTVARNAAGEGELLEQLLHALFITADVGVNFRVGAIQVSVGNKEVSSVARAGDQDRFERMGEAFFTRVREAYLARAAAAPERFLIIDADRPAKDVSADIFARISSWL